MINPQTLPIHTSTPSLLPLSTVIYCSKNAVSTNPLRPLPLRGLCARPLHQEQPFVPVSEPPVRPMIFPH